VYWKPFLLNVTSACGCAIDLHVRDDESRGGVIVQLSWGVNWYAHTSEPSNGRRASTLELPLVVACALLRVVGEGLPYPVEHEVELGS